MFMRTKAPKMFLSAKQHHNQGGLYPGRLMTQDNAFHQAFITLIIGIVYLS